jgi:transposase
MYSLETRNSIIRYYKFDKYEKGYVNEIIIIWQIARSTFYKWLNLYKNGKLEIIKERNKYKSKITSTIIKYLYTFVKRKTFIKIDKIKTNIFKIFKVKILKSNIYRILKNSKVVYKRIYQKRIQTKKGIKRKYDN